MIILGLGGFSSSRKIMTFLLNSSNLKQKLNINLGNLLRPYAPTKEENIYPLIL
jgi:hypothetical protein